MKNVKFILQRGECSCGPVVLMNILKALKKKVVYNDIQKYKKMLGWKHGEGIYPEEIQLALKKLKIKYFKRINRKVTLGSIDKYLKKDYFGVLLFAWDKNDSHFILIANKNGLKGYTVVNYSFDVVVDEISRTEMKELIGTKSKDSDCPSIWWIKKRKKK